MNTQQVKATRAAIRELKDELAHIPKYIKIPVLAIYPDTENAAWLASKIDHVDEDGNAKALNPKWTEINGRLSLLQERMVEHDRIKEEREIARLQQKLEKAAQVEAAQEKRDKAAREKRAEKERKELERKEQRELNRIARINPYAALSI